MKNTCLNEAHGLLNSYLDQYTNQRIKFSRTQGKGVRREDKGEQASEGRKRRKV